MTKVKDMEQKLEELCKDIKGLVDKPSESIKLEEGLAYIIILILNS